MPGNVVRRGSGRHRRPRAKLELPGDSSFRRKNWAKRITHWVRGSVPYFALSAVLIGALYQLLTLPDFRANVVRVYGNQLVSAETVVAAGSIPRESVLLVEADKVKNQVLKLPQIKEARVDVRLPNQIHIYVTERIPTHLWKVKEALYLVSEDGILLGASDTPRQLVTIVDVEARPVDTGTRLDVDALAAAARLSILLPREMGITPGYYEYSSKEGVVVPTSFAGRVIFGRDDDIPEKVTIFKAISDRIKQDSLKVQAVDLRVKDKPYLR